MKTYLAGPMAGYVDHNYPLFIEVTKYLREREYEIESPVECINNIEGTIAWEDCLRKDLVLMLHCQRIFLLPNWKQSKGATLEVFLGACVGSIFAEVRPHPSVEGAWDIWMMSVSKMNAMLWLIDAHFPGWLRGLRVQT